jgi:hypothetical protein
MHILYHLDAQNTTSKALEDSQTTEELESLPKGTLVLMGEYRFANDDVDEGEYDRLEGMLEIYPCI